MTKIVPVGDYFMVEVRSKEDNPLDLVGVPDVEEGVREGKVVGIGDLDIFFGFNTFMFDSSLGNDELRAYPGRCGGRRRHRDAQPPRQAERDEPQTVGRAA